MNGKLLAEQGFAKAQINLGLIYRRGQGIPQNYKEAMKWFRLSAEQENAKAQVNLSTMYFEGWGSLKDYVAAYKWANLASGKENLPGINIGRHLRDEIAKSMTPSQIVEAQNLSRECVGNNYKGC